MTLPALTRLFALSSLVLLAACGGQLEDPRFPTGSSPLVTSSDFALIYAVDTDGGTVAAIDGSNNEVSQVQVGSEPTRITRAGDRLFVTLRGERNVAVLEETEAGLELISKIPVGAEPFGIVASEDGNVVFVAASLEGEVHEIDTADLQITRSWTVRDEPRWLALHPSGHSLYAGSVRGGVYTRIDLRSDSVHRRFLPEVQSLHLETFDEITLTGRITGDVSVSPNGKVLGIPVLYVDNVTPVGDPIIVSDDDDIDGDEEFVGEGGTGYASTTISRFNPGIVTIALDTHGDFRVTDPHVISLSGTGSDFEILRSYPAGVTFSPDGDSMVASLEGAGAVLSVPVDMGVTATSSPHDGMMLPEMSGPGVAGMEQRASRTFLTPAGPRGVAFVTNQEALTYSFLDRQVARIDHPEVAVNEGHRPQEVDVAMSMESGVLESRDAVVFAQSALSPDVEEGRRLFYSTNESSMAAEGAGVSCATCHFDGRNDGLTWPFQDDVVRQTPSLAGVVSLTAPVTWTDDVATVFDEVMLTSQGRMGGSGLHQVDGLKVASFVDWTRDADVPLADSTSDSILRGQALFEREDVGCADCHSGASYTDNEPYEMYGLPNVRTRSLVGIAASAPYLHDGSAPTIEAVLITARDGEMGDTGSLSDDEMKDLANFVKSL